MACNSGTTAGPTLPRSGGVVPLVFIFAPRMLRAERKLKSIRGVLGLDDRLTAAPEVCVLPGASCRKLAGLGARGEGCGDESYLGTLL